MSLVMVVFLIAFIWIHLSSNVMCLFLFVILLDLMPYVIFYHVGFVLWVIRLGVRYRLSLLLLLLMVGLMVVLFDFDGDRVVWVVVVLFRMEVLYEMLVFYVVGCVAVLVVNTLCLVSVF